MSGTNYPKDFFYANKILQRITGFWLPGRELHFVLRVMYYLYVAFAYSVSVFFFICEFIIFRETIKDLNKFVRQFGMLFTHVVGILKFYILVFCRKDIKKIMDALQDKDYMYEPQDNFQPGLMMRKAKMITLFVSVTVSSLHN